MDPVEYSGGSKVMLGPVSADAGVEPAANTSGRAPEAASAMDTKVFSTQRRGLNGPAARARLLGHANMSRALLGRLSSAEAGFAIAPRWAPAATTCPSVRRSPPLGNLQPNKANIYA